jgi:hypothetical protein
MPTWDIDPLTLRKPEEKHLPRRGREAHYIRHPALESRKMKKGGTIFINQLINFIDKNVVPSTGELVLCY